MREAYMQYVEETHVQRQQRDHLEFIPERRVSFLRFYDHGLVRIVRNLTIKNIGAGLTFPMIYLLLF